MKHSRLMMLAILLTLVGRTFADNLTIPSVELNAGETKDVTINLNSSEKKYVAFQFDIILPEGVTVELKSNGKPKISLNEDRIDDHTLTVQDLGSGSYRLLCFSMTNAEFYGTSGALVKMTLQADENASAGTKEGFIKSQVFTETDGHQVKWDDVSFNISIASSSGSSTEASSLTVSEIELKKGNTQEAAINLNNGSKKYVAFQFDVVLPEGVSIAKKENGKFKISLNADRIDDHTLTVQDLGSGSYRLLCFSMTNAEFYGTSGALVNMTLQADESASAGTKEGVIKSQVFTETDGHQVKWDDVSFNISIAAAVIPEITADNKTRKYGEDNPELTYTTTATLTGVPQLTTTATKTSPVGEYEIVVERGTVQGDYTSKNGKLTITKAPLTITAKNYTIKQGEALPTFEAEYSGFKNNETDAVLTKKPTLSTTATSASEPGTYEIVVSGAEATNYDITYVKGTLTITQADPVTVTEKSYSRKYGEANPAFEYTTSGAALSGTPSISCEATATSPVGEYDIVVSKGSITNYNVTLVNGKLTVTKAPLTITAKSYTIKQGDALPTFEAEYSGFKNNETDAVITKKPTLSTTATSASEPGTYEITVSGAEAQNYDITYVKGTLTITKADEVVVTAKSYSRKYGEANPTFEYTTSGATLSGTPSISCEATATSPVGEYDIVVSKGSITNYNVTLVNGKLTVTKAPLTITAKSYTIKQGDALPTFEAEYAGFKNNETDAVLTTKPTITTTATSASEPGTYEIVVSGAEATNYDITYVKGTLTISAVEVNPINETETTTFSETVNENTDLSNTIIDNTYYTMSEENGDGYDATEQAIVLNSTTSKEQMNTVQDAQVGDATMQENFNGIIFEVPAGNGNITVEAKTIGSHILNVQIGNDEPTKITKSERGTEEVPYDVKESTYVYLYASTSGASGAPQRAAAANSVLLYSYKVDVLVNGIHLVTYSNQENAKWYTMDGLQLQGKPTKKGLYIVNGRKVIVK